MDFDLRLLRHARTLAEEGSFARASRALHLTQPALTRSIQELERRTGVKLFDRAQGGVLPTDVGRIFLAHAREVLGHADALDRQVATLRGAGTGRLVVGSGTFPTAMFMGAAAAPFLCRNPSVGIRFVNDNWIALVAALRRRELDFVVAAAPSASEAAELDVQPLARRQAYFLARPGHPLAAGAAPSLGDIARHPVVSTGRFPAELTMIMLAARGAREPSRPFPDVACESHEMMRLIALGTDHVLLSSPTAHVAALERGELVVLPFVEPRICAQFAVLRLQARTLPSIAEELIRDVVAADQASVEAERGLVSRFVTPARAPRAGRRRSAAPLAAG